jgi:hypothetical protein
MYFGQFANTSSTATRIGDAARSTRPFTRMRRRVARSITSAPRTPVAAMSRRRRGERRRDRQRARVGRRYESGSPPSSDAAGWPAASTVE